MDRPIPLAAPAAFRFAAWAGPFALLLTGCTDQRVAQLEERMAAVEIKAEAAEKRSKVAESIASRSADSPQVVELPPPSDDNPNDEGDSGALADQNDGVLPGG
ncbi:hypothetical protein [Novosphingobium sp. Chol11]|uniref:hypothetical protein n=1 Tax=Novosphingobium sp. Chol11 TaxID=1385763 RepID=UPI0025D20EF4|nr:hypothetical protein [Novosphingobium sp. Chol11]